MKKNKLDNFSQYFTNYTELRYHENRDLKIAIRNGDIVGNSLIAKSGISARVFDRGNWGFSSHPITDNSTVKNVIKTASQNAYTLSDKYKRDISLPSSSIVNEVNDFTTKNTKLSQKEIINFLKEIDDYILKTYPQLNSRTLSLSSLDMEKYLLTSDGCNTYSMNPKTSLYIILSMMKDGQPTNLLTSYGTEKLGQFEDRFTTLSAIQGKIDTQVEELMQKVDGAHANAGIQDVILDSALAGVLAHEAIGHTTEADLVLGGSVAGDYLNKLVADPLINLIDFAHTALGETAPVPVYVDDEGTKAKDVTILKNGELKAFMHNKESAQHFGVPPTGNARGFAFYDEPLIRMRNTAILPGTSKLDDMIASVDDGYYLMAYNNGQADSTSEFMFGCTKGYEIKNGVLGRAIKDTTISGVAFDMLKTVSMISDDMHWTNGGYCGKKQPMAVGMGGPAIKCKVNIGGR